MRYIVKLYGIIALLISSFGLCGETLWLKPHSDIKNPLGLWVIPSNGSLKTSITIFKDKSFNVYLTYNYVISDVMPPFTSSEYGAPVLDGKNLEIKERGKDFVYIEDLAKTRAVNGQEKESLCGVYDYQSNKKRLIAYCGMKNSNGTFELFQASDNQKIATLKSGSKWEISIEKNGDQNIYRTAALMLAGLRIFKRMNSH